MALNATSAEQLVQDLVEIGVDEGQARTAIRNCERAILTKGAQWAFSAGGLAGVLARSPVAGMVGFVSGAALGQVKALESEACRPTDLDERAQGRLRDEVRKWTLPVQVVKDLINP